MPYPNEHAARLHEPNYDDYHRTKGGTIYGSVDVPSTVSIIWGHNKKNPPDAQVPQALRFPTSDWTEKEARAWLKDNNVKFISFEPASGENAKNFMKDATLKIYGDIGEDLSVPYIDDQSGTISAKLVSEFLEKNKDADRIIVRINSRGGDVQEGWAIHDLLINSGKTIVTVGEGKVYSIATIIFLAGSERDIMKNADGLIHNPFIPPYTLADKYESSDLEKIAESLRQEEAKILDFYASVTGSPADKLAEYMKDETKLSAEDMLNLGFATKIVEPVMAFAYIKPKNNFEMDEKAFFEKLGSALDGAVSKMLNLSRVNPSNQTLTDKDGKELKLEKDTGAPAIGDKASPDGTFTMADGKVIVIANGVITEIQDAPMTGTELEKAQAEITALKEQLSALETEKVNLVKAEATFKEKEAVASTLIADLTKLKNKWQPASRSNTGGNAADKVGEIDLSRVRELNVKLNKSE